MKLLSWFLLEITYSNVLETKVRKLTHNPKCTSERRRRFFVSREEVAYHRSDCGFLWRVDGTAGKASGESQGGNPRWGGSSSRRPVSAPALQSSSSSPPRLPRTSQRGIRERALWIGRWETVPPNLPSWLRCPSSWSSWPDPWGFEGGSSVLRHFLQGTLLPSCWAWAGCLENVASYSLLGFLNFGGKFTSPPDFTFWFKIF